MAYAVGASTRRRSGTGGWLARGVQRGRRRALGVAISAAPRVTAVIDARSGLAHLVTDAAMAAGYRGSGRYAAVCGIEVLPASLTVPMRRGCAGCTSWSAARRWGILGGG